MTRMCSISPQPATNSTTTGPISINLWMEEETGKTFAGIILKMKSAGSSGRILKILVYYLSDRKPAFFSVTTMEQTGTVWEEISLWFLFMI